MNLFATIVVVSLAISATVAVIVNVSSSSSNDIQNEIEFLRHHTENRSILFPVYSDRNAETAAELRCYISAIDKVNETHNLGDGWVETRVKLVSAADNLEKCTNELCSLVYYLRAVYVSANYFHQLKKHHPEAHDAIDKQIAEQCPEYDGTDPESERDAAAKSFRCMVSAIDNVNETNNLGEKWAEAKKQILLKVDGLEKCTNRKCTQTYFLAASNFLEDYLEEVRETNPEAYEAIEKQINEQCNN